MFLKTLVRRNRPFVEAVISLHQAGRIPASSYALDLDMVQTNARIMADKAEKLGLKIFAMSKQIGRNPVAFRALAAGGIDSYVAVDLACARPIYAEGYRVGHIGHLVQIPRGRSPRCRADEARILDRVQPREGPGSGCSQRQSGS